MVESNTSQQSSKGFVFNEIPRFNVPEGHFDMCQEILPKDILEKFFDDFVPTLRELEAYNGDHTECWPQRYKDILQYVLEYVLPQKTSVYDSMWLASSWGFGAVEKFIPPLIFYMCDVYDARYIMCKTPTKSHVSGDGANSCHDVVDSAEEESSDDDDIYEVDESKFAVYWPIAARARDFVKDIMRDVMLNLNFNFTFQWSVFNLELFDLLVAKKLITSVKKTIMTHVKCDDPEAFQNEFETLIMPETPTEITKREFELLCMKECGNAKNFVERINILKADFKILKVEFGKVTVDLSKETTILEHTEPKTEEHRNEKEEVEKLRRRLVVVEKHMDIVTSKYTALADSLKLSPQSMDYITCIYQILRFDSMNVFPTHIVET